MTYVELLDRSEVFEFTEGSQRVEGEDEYLYVLEGVDESKLFDLQVGEVCILQYRRVFDVKLFDIKVVLSFK